jgi:hypothetical protein
MNVLGGSDTENTVTKGTKSNGRLAEVGPVRERHLQDRNIMNDRGGDSGDQEENGGSEEEEGSKMMKETSVTHLDGVDFLLRGFGVLVIEEGWMCERLAQEVRRSEDSSKRTALIIQ